MSYTKIAKPSAQTYTNLTKPSASFTLTQGLVTGILGPVTYALTRNFGTAYTKLIKPTTSWTKLIKPV